MDSPRWIFEPAIAPPTTHEIHVWQTRLDIPLSDVSRLHETLTVDERDRADRFYFEKHRRRFIAGRGTLRTIISRYLGVPPDSIRFIYNDKRKPALVEPKVNGFEFNVSHSDELALYAFALGVPIGVDVEVIRPVSDMEAIAKRFFSPLEFEMFQRMSHESRPEAFFTCFTVSLSPSEPARFIQFRDAGHTDTWSLHHLSPGPGAVGAVALPSLNRQVVHRQFL
jgi:4'-phosphopantetheinyl transferase